MTTVAARAEPNAAARRRVGTILCVRSIDAGILGPENLILTLAEALSAQGVRFIIVNLWDGVPPAVELHDEAVRRGLQSHVLSLAWGMDPSMFPRLRALIRRYRPDVILTHDQKSEIAALVASRFTGTPLIGAYYGRLAIRSLRLKLQEATSFLSFRFFDRVLANSRVQREELLRWRLPPQRVAVLPSFVDTRRLVPPSPADVAAARAALGIPPERAVLATVARLAVQKGHTYMVQALAEIREAFPDVLYLVVGDGDAAWHGEGGIRGDLERQVAGLGLAEHVRFLGHRRDLLTILHATDLLVSPSLREGMSVTLLDAMAAGRPIVATAVGGSPDSVAHGETGLLVRPGDPGALARAVCELLGDRDRLQRMGIAGRRRAEERFDARGLAAQVLDICAEIGESSRRGRARRRERGELASSA